MKRYRFLFFPLALACIILPGLLRSSAQADDLVDFTLRDFKTGQDICTTAYRGKVMLIIFGSIYCKPCVEMLPVVRQLRDRYEQAGLVVVGIDIDISSEPEKIRLFIETHQIRHLYLIDTIKVARQNRVFTLPTTLIVNQKGGIEKRLMGLQDYEKLEKIIKELLQESKSCAPYLQH